jgi:hypothetical protein
MPEYSYTTVPGKIRSFFEKLRKATIPDHADHQWLSKLGFGSKNDPTLLGMLKQIGFTDHAGTPARTWFDYKASPRETMARALKEGYRELFNLYEADQPPCELSNDELVRFFSSQTGKAEGTVSKMLATFRALCSLADFNAPVRSASKVSAENPQFGRADDRQVVVNVNINLPETEDEEVYRKILKVLKEYLDL